MHIDWNLGAVAMINELGCIMTGVHKQWDIRTGCVTTGVNKDWAIRTGCMITVTLGLECMRNGIEALGS